MASGKSEEWFAAIGLDRDTGNALQDHGFDDLESLKLLEETLVMKCFPKLNLKQKLTLLAKIKELKGDTGGSLNLTGLAKDVKVNRQHYGGSSNLPRLAQDGKVGRQDDGGSSNLSRLAQDGKVGRQDDGGSSNLPALVPDCKISRQVYDENPAPNSELRLVVFGKTGNGKSSTANTILGKVGFVKHEGQGSGTKVCKKQQVKLNGKNITIIDTPGVSDPLRAPEEILHEISRCLSFVRPGPHALLFVVNIKATFTQEEENAYVALRRLFASQLNLYVIVVFTHFDELKNDEEKLKQILADHVQEIDIAEKDERKLPDLRKVLADVNDRYVTFSNTADKAITDEQVLKLLETIQGIADLNNCPYFEDKETEAATATLERKLNAIKQKEFGLPTNEVWKKLTLSTDETGSDRTMKLKEIVDEIEGRSRVQPLSARQGTRSRRALSSAGTQEQEARQPPKKDEGSRCLIM